MTKAYRHYLKSQQPDSESEQATRYEGIAGVLLIPCESKIPLPICISTYWKTDTSNTFAESTNR
ncbi:MAG: hypothetical protein MK240_08115 [Opitutales bacterium]|nr:hypothetical protein [Opitutales bacterium]